MFDVLEHILRNREKEALGEVRRVLKKSGKLIISTPNAKPISNFFDPAWYFGHRHYSPAYITAMLRDAGFNVEKVYKQGGIYESFSMILFYFFKWVLHREIPFKSWFDKKREEEYLKKKSGFVTLFVKAIK